MKLFPALRLGWLNGWLLVGLFYLTYTIVLAVLPKDVVARLYDRSGRSKRRKRTILVGSFFAFILFGLIIFTPLAIGSAAFIPGLVLYFLGLTGFVVALFNFASAPRDQPITTGLYRLSRHPQQIMFLVASAGICLAIGSWLALLILIVSSGFLHTRILAEEEACLERYGDSYRDYMHHVPRYLLLPKPWSSEG